MKHIDEETYIISDLHFGHSNITKFEPCRLEQMTIEGFNNHDEWLIQRWNSTIKESDNVLVLGDIAFKNLDKYIPRLNGNITLILGNHDRSADNQSYKCINVIDGIFLNKIDNRFLTKLQIEDITLLSGFITELRDKRILFSHYPVFDSNEYDRKNNIIQNRVKIFEGLYKDLKCDYNIHGHTHSDNSSFKNCINVSMEKIDFKPIKIKDLLDKEMK